MMPLARYFVFVGGALVALLFAVDFFSPKAVADSGTPGAGTIDKSTLRIRSEQKWPERVVFDTTQTTIVPNAAPAQAAPSTQAALPAAASPLEITGQSRVRETFAQFVPVEPKKADAVAAKKRKTVKGPGQPLRIARNTVFGVSTW